MIAKTARTRKVPRCHTQNIFRVGLACNANCRFCNVPPESFDFPLSVPRQQLMAQIDFMALTSPRRILAITGGEPAVRGDLAELVGYAKRKGIGAIDLQTNATLLSRGDLVGRLRQAGLTSAFVALHSHIPAIQDGMLGMKNALEKCLSGIERLIENKIYVVLNPVLTTMNYRALPEFVVFVARKFPRIRRISLSVVQPRGRAWVNFDLVPRYGDIARYVETALMLARRLKLIMHNPYCGLPLCIGGWHNYPDMCLEYLESVQTVSPAKKKVERGPDILVLADEHHGRIMRDKIKPASCSKCRLTKFCCGVWREYAELHPLDDLKPIR